MREANIASLDVLVEQSRRRLSRQTLPSAVERYLEVSLYLLIVTGFATLASTGRLDALSLITVSAALLFRGYLLIRNSSINIPQRWTSYVTIGYVLFYVADYYLISGAFVPATVHLVLFSMVVKIFSVQRDRDHLYLAILSLLAVLAASVLTVDSMFLAAFSVFMLLAVTTFISMEMKRSSTAAVARAREGSGPGARAMSLALSGAGVAMVLAILVGATGIFFILPRLSAGYLSNFSPRNEWVSGFSDNVRLGEIGTIKQSNTIVMHVQVEGDHGGATDLKWRGIALSTFDGRRWYNPMNQHAEQHSPNGRFDFYQDQVNLGNLPRLGRSSPQLRLLRYRVTMEPVTTNVLFMAPVPTELFSSIQDISIDEGGGVFNLDRSRLVESYTGISLIPQPSVSRLRSSPAKVPPAIAVRYLQVPQLDRRIRELAQRITAAAGSDFDKAVAVEQYLRTHYRYTLQMGYRAPRDPLAYFLFERKEGHCEYFASSMAIMLRAIGIPARVVNGFRGADYNDLTGSYIVRGRHAHSWVEVYISGYTWIPFDPTPPDPARGRTTWARFLLYVDAAREFWREWVVLYDFQRQQLLANTAVARSRNYYDGVRRWLRRTYEGLLERAQRLKEQASAHPEPWGMYGAGFVVAVILLANLRRIWRALRRYEVARRPEHAPQAAASIWYTRMTRVVARRGWAKLPSQTPQEFAAAIKDPALAAPVARFTAHYERARFGDSAQDAQRLPELFGHIRSR